MSGPQRRQGVERRPGQRSGAGIGTPDRVVLRTCPADGCPGFFLQHDPRRAFCSPGCATRTRVARHHHRHKAGIGQFEKG